MTRSTFRRPSQYLIVFALWLLVFSASSQIMIISPILNDIGMALDIQQDLLGTLVAAYSIMVGTFAIVAGPVSDKIGRRRILLLGTGVMSLALICHGLVVDYYSFLAVRLFAGAAGGILSGAAVSYIGDYFPYERRGWATGWVMSGTAAGQIAGIPLGVELEAMFGFRSPFYLFAVTMGITFILIFLRVPQPPVRRREGRMSVSSAISDYWAMLRRPEIAAAAFAFFLMFLGLSSYVVYFPFWLETELGATERMISTLFLVGGVANVITGPQAGRLSDRIGRKGLILLSCLGLFAVMLLTTPVVRTIWIAYPAFFLFMALIAMRVSPFSALLTALVPDHQRGSLMSLTVAIGQLGFAIGASLAGPLFDALGYGSNTVLASASVLGMGLMIWFMVPEPERNAVAPKEPSGGESRNT